MERENEINNVKTEKRKTIKTKGNRKRAQEGTHARGDSKTKKKRENEQHKVK